MAAVKFERTSAPVCSVEFSRNPTIKGGDSGTIGYLQPKDRSDGGDWYIYDKGIDPENYRHLSFENNPELDWTNFKTFLAAVIGSVYNFTFTDPGGNTYTARVWNADNIPWRYVATGRMAFEIELMIES